MSRRVVIDSLAFGREGASLQGELVVASLTRVFDSLTGSAGVLTYRIDGGMGPRKRPQLFVEVAGVLFLRCQRCLETLPYRLDVHDLLEFIDSDDDLTQEELEDDSRDFLLAQTDLDVASLIEDEILLALPTVPRHEDCVLPVAGQKEAEAKLSPFSVLAGFHGRP